MSSGEAIAAQQAIVRNQATLSFIKDSANQGKQIASLVEQGADSAESLATSGSRGTNVNFKV